ncbi:hypothetical protein ABZ719_19235 [Streptomyces sp. NPDC006743]|uniref:hypothetical protein n=1 Tax=Streptomyces sp. NPDC006743 TaxID=3154480 RepID=UPI0034543256
MDLLGPGNGYGGCRGRLGAPYCCHDPATWRPAISPETPAGLRPAAPVVFERPSTEGAGHE